MGAFSVSQEMLSLLLRAFSLYRRILVSDAALVRELENALCHVIRAGDFFKFKLSFFTRGLDRDIAVPECGLEKSIRGARDILDIVEAELAHDASEESVLFDIDDALIRDDPHIQVPVDEVLEDEEPRKEEEDASTHHDQGVLRFIRQHVRHAELQDGIADEREEEHECRAEHERNEHEPMAAQKEDDVLICFGVGEACEVNHGSMVISVIVSEVPGMSEVSPVGRIWAG